MILTTGFKSIKYLNIGSCQKSKLHELVTLHEMYTVVLLILALQSKLLQRGSRRSATKPPNTLVIAVTMAIIRRYDALTGKNF